MILFSIKIVYIYFILFYFFPRKKKSKNFLKAMALCFGNDSFLQISLMAHICKLNMKLPTAAAS